ncbi:S-layer homology domain-containing protein [Patescibacteria group bacterium]
MKSIKKFILFIVILLATSNGVHAFTDIPEYHRNYIAVKYLQEQGIIQGYQDGSFRPERPVSRAEFLKLVLYSANIPLNEINGNNFSDVEDDQWYTPVINKAFHEGWINGYEDGTFKPHTNINKAEAIKIIGEVENWQLNQLNHHPFNDVNISSWFGPYIAYAKKHQFLEETSESFGPADLMTRAKTSEVLYRILAQEQGIDIITIPEDQFIIIDTPWTAQAPYGEWSDIRQSEGCEEASALMAIKWAKGENLNLDQAKEIILDISQFQTTKYGTAHDTSAKDTLDWIIKDYFNYQDAELRLISSVQEIKMELYKGNLVIAPMNGKKLPNPYFSPPGPLQHMLLIKGYDDQTQEFITNEPGTRFGENFRYSIKTMQEAIYDYESGENSYLPSEQRRNIIIIHPQ